MPDNKKILLEDTWQFKPNRSKLSESKRGTLTELSIPGTLSVCDIVNGNGRRYRRAVWEKNLQEESKLMQLIKRNSAFGLLEHPASGTVDLQSPISHAITNVKLEANGELSGNLIILDGPGLPEGQKLRTLVDFGYDPMVSSRGYGTVIKDSTGVDDVQEDFICEGWDVVFTPSFVQAQLNPKRTSTTESKATTEALSVIVTEHPEPPLAALLPKITRESFMNIDTLRTQIGALKSVDMLASSQRTIADSFSAAVAIHRQISEAQAANPGISWDCTKLHEELSDIEKSWFASVQNLKESNTKLKENQEKLLLVSENLAKTGKLFRTQLSESYKRQTKLTELFEIATRRGRGWYKIAEQRNTVVEKKNHHIDVVCGALDINTQKLVNVESGKDRSNAVGQALESLAKKYHKDTTALARALVEVKFPEKSKEEVFQKKLDEAKTAEEVLEIRNEIEGKPKGSKVPVTEAAKIKGKAPTVKSSSEPVKITEAAKSTETSDAKKAVVITEGVTVIRGDAIGFSGLGLDQAVGIAQRLSRSSK